MTSPEITRGRKGSGYSTDDKGEICDFPFLVRRIKQGKPKDLNPSVKILAPNEKY